MASAGQPLELRSCIDKPKIVALTFDADMTPGMLSELKSGRIASWYNEKSSKSLRQQQVPATLFLTGLWIEAYSAATKELSADPLFELGNHSYSHGAFHSPCYRLSRYGNRTSCGSTKDRRPAEGNTRRHIKNISAFPVFVPTRRRWKTVEDQGYTIIGGDVDGADALRQNVRNRWCPMSWRMSIRAASSFCTCTAAPMRRQPQRRSLTSSRSSGRRATPSSKYRTCWSFPRTRRSKRTRVRAKRSLTSCRHAGSFSVTAFFPAIKP